MPTEHWTTLEQLIGCHSKTASAMAPASSFKKKKKDFCERSQLLTYQANFKNKLTYDSPPWGLSHGFIISQAESIVAKAVQSGHSIHVPHWIYSESSHIYSFFKKEESRITFKKKTNNPFHTGVGKATKSPYTSLRARKEDGHFSDALKTFPRKFWHAAGAHQSAALAKGTEGKIPC